jgi:hypothetical protein
MSARRRYFAALAGATFAGAALLASCYTSPAPQTFPHATSPYGAEVLVQLVDGGSMTGELLEVTDTTVTLLTRPSGRVAVARAAMIRQLEFDRYNVVRYEGDANPSRKALENARRFARFPYGMSPAVRATVLAKAGQVDADTLAAARQP